MKKKVEFDSLKKSKINSLYKYSRFDIKNHYQDLLNNILYFPTISQLNDPFDSQISIKYELCPDDELDKLIIRTIPNYDEKNFMHQLKRINAKTDIKMNPNKIEERLFGFIENRVGIFALAERRDNLLLWSHYSDNHRGFCLEFDAQKLYNLLIEVFYNQNVKAFIFKVKYQDDYPILIPQIGNSEERLQKQFLIKSNDWRYEQEWRILVLDGVRRNIIDQGYFKNIYFGLNTSDENMKTSIDILRKSNPKIGLYKAVKKKDAFGLNFNEINV